MSIICYKAPTTKARLFSLFNQVTTVWQFLQELSFHISFLKGPNPPKINSFLSTETMWCPPRLPALGILPAWVMLLLHLWNYRNCDDHTRKVTKTPKGVPRATGNEFTQLQGGWWPNNHSFLWLMQS